MLRLERQRSERGSGPKAKADAEVAAAHAGEESDPESGASSPCRAA